MHFQKKERHKSENPIKTHKAYPCTSQTPETHG